MDDLLFYEGDLSASLEAQTEKMRRTVEAESEASLIQADAEAWAEALAHHYGAACPVLKTDEVWQEPPADTTVDLSHDQSRHFSGAHSDYARRFPGYRVVVHFPFEGDASAFKLRPSQFTLNPPRGRIGKDELLMTVEFPQDSPRQIDPAAQAFMNSVQQCLGFARTQIETFNAQLQQQALSAIASRLKGANIRVAPQAAAR